MDFKNRKINKIRVLAVIEAIIILIMFIVIVLNMFSKDDNAVFVNNTTNDTQVRSKTIIEKEETLYQIDGEKILMDDSIYGQIYYPVIDGVDKSVIETDNIVNRNGYSFYIEDEEITSILGIDVSKFQGEIDWQQVADAGVEFAMLRVGGRSYGDGDLYHDEMFEQYYQGAINAGIHVGVYFFSQAITVEEAVEEADFVIDTIDGLDIKYPVVFDWELIYDDVARTDDVPVDVLNDSSIAFCERIKSVGYTPMIYQNLRTTMFKLDVLRLNEYDFWLAQYNEKPSYYYDYQIWQYSSTGSIPGISGDVDLNLSFKDYSLSE